MGASAPISKTKKNMETKKEKKDLVRKAGRTNGVITQKMVSFRVDIENLNWLMSHPNKGRYLNDLIERDRTKNNH